MVAEIVIMTLHQEEECSASRLAYWGREYLPIVWNMTGVAECCTQVSHHQTEKCSERLSHPGRVQ